MHVKKKKRRTIRPCTNKILLQHLLLILPRPTSSKGQKEAFKYFPMFMPIKRVLIGNFFRFPFCNKKLELIYDFWKCLDPRSRCFLSSIFFSWHYQFETRHNPGPTNQSIITPHWVRTINQIKGKVNGMSPRSLSKASRVQWRTNVGDLRKRSLGYDYRLNRATRVNREAIFATVISHGKRF